MSSKCCECGKSFINLDNLRRHAKKIHPDKVDLIAPKKKYKYRCEPCKKDFYLLKDFNCHKNTHKTAETSRKTVYKQCPLCDLKASRANLVKHIVVDHDIKIETSTFEFASFEEFLAWKIQIEKSTRSQFVKERGTDFRNNKEFVMYYCHRSGTYTSKSKGARLTKTQGSNKIDKYCPAFMKFIKNKNKCKVFFVDKHVGHENDLGHLYLTSKERETLASKIALKVPISEILNEVRDSGGPQFERIHLLTKKDLYNIGHSFNLLLNYKPKSKNKIEEYEEQLAKEKEKLKANQNKNIDNIVCIEQVEAFKKLCAPIEQILTDIQTKSEKVKLVPSPRILHDKKIRLKRNKLRSTKKEHDK